MADFYEDENGNIISAGQLPSDAIIQDSFYEDVQGNIVSETQLPVDATIVPTEVPPPVAPEPVVQQNEASYLGSLGRATFGGVRALSDTVAGIAGLGGQYVGRLGDLVSQVDSPLLSGVFPGISGFPYEAVSSGLQTASDYIRNAGAYDQSLVDSWVPPPDTNTTGGAIRSFAEQIPAFATKFAPLALGGGIPAMAAGFGLQGAGESYTNFLNAGVPEDRAALGATGMGILNAGAAALPIATASGNILKGLTPVQRGAATLAELALQGGTQDSAGRAITDQTTGNQSSLGDYLSGFGISGALTALTGGYPMIRLGQRNMVMREIEDAFTSHQNTMELLNTKREGAEAVLSSVEDAPLTQAVAEEVKKPKLFPNTVAETVVAAKEKIAPNQVSLPEQAVIKPIAPEDLPIKPVEVDNPMDDEIANNILSEGINQYIAEGKTVGEAIEAVRKEAHDVLASDTSPEGQKWAQKMLDSSKTALDSLHSDELGATSIITTASKGGIEFAKSVAQTAENLAVATTGVGRAAQATGDIAEAGRHSMLGTSVIKNHAKDVVDWIRGRPRSTTTADMISDADIKRLLPEWRGGNLIEKTRAFLNQFALLNDVAEYFGNHPVGSLFRGMSNAYQTHLRDTPAKIVYKAKDALHPYAVASAESRARIDAAFPELEKIQDDIISKITSNPEYQRLKEQKRNLAEAKQDTKEVDRLIRSFENQADIDLSPAALAPALTKAGLTDQEIETVSKMAKMMQDVIPDMRHMEKLKIRTALLEEEPSIETYKIARGEGEASSEQREFAQKAVARYQAKKQLLYDAIDKQINEFSTFGESGIKRIYFPRSRSGDYQIIASKPETKVILDANGVPQEMTQNTEYVFHTSGMKRQQTVKELQADGYRIIKKPQLIKKHPDAVAMEEGASDTNFLLDRAREILQGNSENINDKWLAAPRRRDVPRGFASHYAFREKTPGWNPEVGRSMTEYMQSLAGSLGRAEFDYTTSKMLRQKPEGYSALAKGVSGQEYKIDSKEFAGAYALLQKFKSNAIASEKGIYNTMTKVAVLDALAGVPMAPIYNLTQLENVLALVGAKKTIYASYLAKDPAALEKSHPVLHQLLGLLEKTDDLRGNVRGETGQLPLTNGDKGMLGKGLDTAVDVGMKPFMTVEQFTRRTAAIAFYMDAMEKGFPQTKVFAEMKAKLADSEVAKKLTDQSPEYQYARSMTQKTMFHNDRGARPIALMTGPGRMMNVLKNFGANQFSFLRSLTASKSPAERAAARKLLGYHFTIAGARGMPGVEFLIQGAKTAGYDPENAYDDTKDNVGNMADLIGLKDLTRGVFEFMEGGWPKALLGMNTSAAIALPVTGGLGVSPYLPGIGPNDSGVSALISMFGGIPGSWINRIDKARKDMAAPGSNIIPDRPSGENPRSSLAQLMPRELRKLFETYTTANLGVVNRNNEPIGGPEYDPATGAVGGPHYVKLRTLFGHAFGANMEEISNQHRKENRIRKIAFSQSNENINARLGGLAARAKMAQDRGEVGLAKKLRAEGRDLASSYQAEMETNPNLAPIDEDSVMTAMQRDLYGTIASTKEQFKPDIAKFVRDRARAAQ